MAEILKNRKPGIYVAVANPIGGKRVATWKNRATQWFVVTDLGVSTYMGRDGLHIGVRSLASAKPIEKVNVLLIARNNAELARGLHRRDWDGQVRARARTRKRRAAGPQR